MQRHVINTEAELFVALQQAHPQSSKRLGEILIEEAYLDQDQLHTALQMQLAQPGAHLGDTLEKLGYCNHEQITAGLAHKLGIPFVDIGQFEISDAVIRQVSADLALQYNVLPLSKHNNHLIIATDNPLNWQAQEVVRFHTNLNVEVVVTSSATLGRLLEKYYLQHDDAGLDELNDELKLIGNDHNEEQDNLLITQEVVQEAQKKPVVRLVNAIIMQGIKLRASDIHIRPGKSQIDILYRIDGKLRLMRTISRVLLAPLVSRIKITGRMDIAERRMPQDGHARVMHEGNSIDLRISIMPTISGESVVIRVLDKQAGLKPMNQLGLGEREMDELRTIISRSFGMLLVTGPTGSGKSTTLYAVLNEIKQRGPHIITVEDPVEYDMEGIDQIQTLNTIGYTFAEALRHILRHDPDVVMIGEIRDLETARIANKAALTGHLVLSTLHTNDAASTVTRLLDMGIEPYLLSSTLLGVLAQRLIRLNCPDCIDVEEVEPHIRQQLGVAEDEVFYRGRGCEACHDSGYKGRAAVVELLVVDQPMAAKISHVATTQEIKETAVQSGMKPLTSNALELARQKKTSLEEVYSVRLE
ncbi:MAG: Flp pilus assembly complex ATPase component TadA [Chromatiales bacterium]|nr:Flp pilus assembly complex ATPase component TadA [Gammaproteobacteria bacterium]MBW6476873.1 Flp pilus assembly complex ATPase component TadA [Chromatiales bacterium]